MGDPQISPNTTTSTTIEALKIVLLNLRISEEQFFLAKTCQELDSLYQTPTFWRLKLGNTTKKEYIAGLLTELKKIYDDSLLYLKSDNKKTKIKSLLGSMSNETDCVEIIGNRTSRSVLNEITKVSPASNCLIGLTKYVEIRRVKLKKYVSEWCMRATSFSSYSWMTNTSGKGYSMPYKSNWNDCGCDGNSGNYSLSYDKGCCGSNYTKSSYGKDKLIRIKKDKKSYSKSTCCGSDKKSYGFSKSSKCCGYK